MDKNSVNWRGVIPALVTPFDREGAIDEGAFRRNIAGMIAQGCHGILVGGCTGEFWALTPDERTRVVRIAADEAKGRLTIFAGTGAIRPDEILLGGLHEIGRQHQRSIRSPHCDRAVRIRT